MKKIIDHIDKKTPHKDRLLLTLLFAGFAFTVLTNCVMAASITLSNLQ